MSEDQRDGGAEEAGGGGGVESSVAVGGRGVTEECEKSRIACGGEERRGR